MEDVKEKENMENMNQENGNDSNQNQGSNKTAEPEKKESFGSKVKGFGKKAWTGIKKVAPYAGAFVAGAGAAVGTLLVMTRPDGTEVQGCLEKDEDLVSTEEFIEGEAEIVDTE